MTTVFSFIVACPILKRRFLTFLKVAILYLHIEISYTKRNIRQKYKVNVAYNKNVLHASLYLHCRMGQYVKVIEDSDGSWWYGSCEGQLGYFPSRVLQR